MHWCSIFAAGRKDSDQPVLDNKAREEDFPLET